MLGVGIRCGLTNILGRSGWLLLLLLLIALVLSYGGIGASQLMLEERSSGGWCNEKFNGISHSIRKDSKVVTVHSATIPGVESV